MEISDNTKAMLQGIGADRKAYNEQAKANDAAHAAEIDKVAAKGAELVGAKPAPKPADIKDKQTILGAEPATEPNLDKVKQLGELMKAQAIKDGKLPVKQLGVNA